MLFSFAVKLIKSKLVYAHKLKMLNYFTLPYYSSHSKIIKEKIPTIQSLTICTPLVYNLNTSGKIF